jgi:rod shape-determining protein MreC
VATYRRARSTRLLVVGLIVTSLVTITVDFRGGDRGPLSVVGRTFASLMGPLQEGVSAAFRPVASFFSSVLRAGSIKEENERLLRELQELTSQVQVVQAIDKENKALRAALGLAERQNYELFGATVIGGSFGSNFEWAIQIDRGSDDGVFVDMAVVTGAGLVGRVISVTPSSSTVMLITDPQSSIAVRLGGPRNLAILEGRGADELELVILDDETEVEPSESVVTASYRLDGVEEGVLPPELPVGVVSRVTPGQGDLGWEVFVQPRVDFSTLEQVFLVRPGEGSGVQPESGP